MWCPNKECFEAEDSSEIPEYVEGVERCPLCGSWLVATLPDWAAPPIEAAPLVAVLTVTDEATLIRAKAILDAARVPYLVQDGPPVVMVDVKDGDRANALLRDLKDAAAQASDAEPPPVKPPWNQPSVCPQCGQPLESSEGDEPLTDCYFCGASLTPSPES